MKLSATLRHPIRTLLIEPWAEIDARVRAPRLGAVAARTATVMTALTAALMLVTMNFLVMQPAFQDQVATAIIHGCGALSGEWGATMVGYRRLLRLLSWVLGVLTCYFVIPALVVRLVFRVKLADCYLAAGAYLRHLPLYLLLFLPVALAVLGVAQLPGFQRQYPFYQHPLGWPDLIAWELAYGLSFVALEFFFRGFMLRGLGAELGSMAVMAMMMPYCMIHFGKPLPECLGAIVTGIVLGTLAMHTRSIWGGVTIHVAVAWLMDGTALWIKTH